MGELARAALRDASTALLEVDAPMAERVISGDPMIDQARTDCERQAYTLLALQAPVASELRMVISTALAAENLERMGDLARHVAELVLRRYPLPVLPRELGPASTELYRRTSAVAETANRMIRTKDLALARSVHVLDDHVDHQHRQLLATVTSITWRHGVQAAVDASLLGRYYERFADHAVTLCDRMIYVLTGVRPGPDADEVRQSSWPDIATRARAWSPH